MPMSPKVKQSGLNVMAALGAVVAISGLMAPVAKAIDQRYVHSATYTSDSINDFYRKQFIAAKLAKIDTVAANLDTLKACIRDPRSTGCRR